ncbi:LOW QUALITY PROTEIN: beta-defensin 108B [Delphinapterus leucas]|uniref:LOW QUALITY PROTEIN: beta-defensin 108B n=1 Tax=Delphinapterus leucas TaxID=9749 RepID=A0A7F8K6F0_DELLE|nr:LOW QUALITY PROTEIN: beta-defensin 108B [Delphinapterus leucas]
MFHTEQLFGESIFTPQKPVRQGQLLAEGRAGFKEVCERPNGSCQEFCIDSEIQAGRRVDGRPYRLPMVHVPEVDPATPKEH